MVLTSSSMTLDTLKQQRPHFVCEANSAAGSGILGWDVISTLISSPIQMVFSGVIWKLFRARLGPSFLS